MHVDNTIAKEFAHQKDRLQKIVDGDRAHAKRPSIPMPMQRLDIIISKREVRGGEIQGVSKEATSLP
jgi:hypothetical protein